MFSLYIKLCVLCLSSSSQWIIIITPHHTGWINIQRVHDPQIETLSVAFHKLSEFVWISEAARLTLISCQ